MPRSSNIYILPGYANPEHLENVRSETEHISKVTWGRDGHQIELSETNSLVEDKYSLNLSSAQYVVEGFKTPESEEMAQNINRQAMIHHHPRGHQEKHLQFKLRKENEVIRITLENLSSDDYQRCIKGFLSVSQKIIELERTEGNILANLQEFFFNERVSELDVDRRFLLGHIKQAYRNDAIRLDNGEPVTSEKLQELKSEIHLLPFLDWED
ncbi:MAG: hypothetical protein KKD17_02900 [Nanoarchaeota archaeon]|nr:hypothetical protein [Nanoarchaeota archaeon]